MLAIWANTELQEQINFACSCWNTNLYQRNVWERAAWKLYAYF